MNEINKQRAILMNSILDDDIDAVKKAIENGADIDTRVFDGGNTVSMLAILKENFEALALFIKEKANLLLTNDKKETIDDVLCDKVVNGSFSEGFATKLIESDMLDFGGKYYPVDGNGTSITSVKGIFEEACRLGTVKFFQQIPKVTNSSTSGDNSSLLFTTALPEIVSTTLSNLTDYLEQVVSSTMSETISDHSSDGFESEYNWSSTTPVGNLTQEISSNSLEGEGVAPLVIAGVAAASAAVVGLVWWGCSYLSKPANNYSLGSDLEAGEWTSLS